MKGVFKQNKELPFLKEEFKFFVEKKDQKNRSNKSELISSEETELVLEETNSL